MSLLPVLGDALSTFPRRLRPYNNVTPFTYQDGITYLETLEELREWLSEGLIGHLNKEITTLIEEYDKASDALKAAMVEYTLQVAADREAFEESITEDREAFAVLMLQRQNAFEGEIAAARDRIEGAVAAIESAASRAESAEAAAETWAANTEALQDLAVSTLAKNSDSLTSKALTPSRTHVVVGPNGNYATIAQVLAAYPNGGVSIELLAGTHQSEKLSPVNQKNVTIYGQGLSSIVEVAGEFINATSNCDRWELKNLTLKNTTPVNTANGITVDYPRRWYIHNCDFNGFGGSTLLFLAGLNSRVEFNTALARDSSNTNGAAFLRITKDPRNASATTIRTRGNYVQGGKQYGFWYSSVKVSILDQDIVEYCDTGYRFENSSGELRSFYGEQNRINNVELYDSPILIQGENRGGVAFEWSANGLASADRTNVNVMRDRIIAGKGIVAGSQTGSSDMTLTPSVRWGSGTPLNVVVAPVGSLFIRTNGGANTTLYVKETGVDATGWVAK